MYRVKQLWWALTARPLSAETEREVQSILTSAEFAIFQRFSNNDKQHAIRVLRLLQQREQRDPSLLKAALLHDVGKARTRLSVLDRCLIVLASRLVPERAQAWGHNTREPFGWRKAFVTKEQHPAWGADSAIAAGSDAQTVALIRWHQADLLTMPHGIIEPMRHLQWADDLS